MPNQRDHRRLCGNCSMRNCRCGPYVQPQLVPVAKAVKWDDKAVKWEVSKCYKCKQTAFKCQCPRRLSSRDDGRRVMERLARQIREANAGSLRESETPVPNPCDHRRLCTDRAGKSLECDRSCWIAKQPQPKHVFKPMQKFKG